MMFWEMLIVVLFGAVFLAVGMFSHTKSEKLRMTCTAQTVGIVSKNIYDSSTNSDGTHSYVYYPVFTYSVSGKEYIKRSGLGKSKMRFNEGDQVTVFYNPDKPDDYYVAEDKKSNKRADIIFIVFGVATIILAIVLPFVIER